MYVVSPSHHGELHTISDSYKLNHDHKGQKIKAIGAQNGDVYLMAV